MLQSYTHIFVPYNYVNESEFTSFRKMQKTASNLTWKPDLKKKKKMVFRIKLMKSDQ